MKTMKKRLMLAAAIAAALGASTSTLRAEEWEANTPYYEDDAWYDVSEWFDGNDYNPTDEAMGRWDDEVFTFADNVASSDNDNFLNWGDYGYLNRDSDWFYDYYDDGYSYWDNQYYSSYYDIDDDGVYDSYSLYSDTDGDGFYEDFDYLSFNSTAKDQDKAKQQAKSQQKELKSSVVEVTGKVTNTKTAKVRDRVHLIAMVQQANGQSATVDLGPGENRVQLSDGDELTASGHALRIGDKAIVIAREASTKDGTIEIDRNGTKYTGTVEKTKTVNVRGTEHRMAKVKTQNGKSMMVDLGPAKNLDQDLSDGAQIEAQGVPVKVKDRVVLMARQIMKDGKKMKIDREMTTMTK